MQSTTVNGTVRDPLFTAHEDTKQRADARRRYSWSDVTVNVGDARFPAFDLRHGPAPATIAGDTSEMIAAIDPAAPAMCGGLPIIRNVSTATIRDLRWVDDPIRDRAIPTLQLAGGACFPLGNILAAIDAKYPEAIDTLASARRSRCTCDDFCDSDCPVHARENALQDRAMLAEADRDKAIAKRKEDKMWHAAIVASADADRDNALALRDEAFTERDTLRRLLDVANAELARLNRALTASRAASRAAYHERPGNPGELAALRGALAKASAEAGEARLLLDRSLDSCVKVERENANLREQIAEWSAAQKSGDRKRLDIADRKRLAAILAWTRGSVTRNLRQRTDHPEWFETRERFNGTGRLTIGTLAEICDRLSL